MDYDNKGKNFYSQQDISIEEKSFKNKTFSLFYAISREKQYNLWTFFILIILETIKFIYNIIFYFFRNYSICIICF